jgi:hypothetical protein
VTAENETTSRGTVNLAAVMLALGGPVARPDEETYLPELSRLPCPGVLVEIIDYAVWL